MVNAKCDSCSQEYKLETGENPSDFQCECGGELKSSEQFDQIEEISNDSETTVKCPYCGEKTPADKKICTSCNKFLRSITTYAKPDKPYKGYLSTKSTSKPTKSFINLGLKWEIVGIGFASALMLSLVGTFIFGFFGYILGTAMGGFIATFLEAENSLETILYGGLSGSLGSVASYIGLITLTGQLGALGTPLEFFFQLIISLIVGGILGIIGGFLGTIFK